MRFDLKVIVTACFVAIVSTLTISAGYPKLFSPYSFSVGIPALFLSEYYLPEPIYKLLAVLPVTTLYCLFVIWQVDGENRIKKLGSLACLGIVVTSIMYNASSFDYGVKYQGITHTLLIYLFSLLLVISFAFSYWLNSKSPNEKNALAFYTLFFSWFGWVAFPWLGELI